MKTTFAALFISMSFFSQAHASMAYTQHPTAFSQITLISGRPDFRLAFTRFIVTDGYSFIGNPEMDLTSQQLSILADHHVTRVSMAEIVDQFGSTQLGLIAQAIRFGATRSPIITLTIGGDSRANNSICSIMSNYPETAFVTAASKQGTRIDVRDEPACAAPNIFRTTGLNQSQDDLASYSSFGDTIRIAAPSFEVPTTGFGGRLRSLTGITPATMIVASELSDFSEQYPELIGSSLIEQFIIERTFQLPNLAGKVEDSRALISFSK